MTTQPALGQRLREWREANGLTIEETALRLGHKPSTISHIEADIVRPLPPLQQRIENLINPDHDAIVAGAVEAIRAALAAGYTSVHIIRPETPERGRVTVLLGEVGDDPEWRKWI